MGKQERRDAKTEREATKQQSAKEKATKDAEDAFWKASGEGERSKAQKKREDSESKKADSIAKKAELKKLAEIEEESMSKKPVNKAAPKVTRYQLDLQKEEDSKHRQQAMEVKNLTSRREVGADEYSRMLESTENTNHQDDTLHASGIEQAIGALSVRPDVEADKHPEKRAKAAWKAFEEKNLPDLKLEKPGLKLNQYRELLWKQWLKSPENPLNQAPQ
uniref:Coiled-coil domain-containing protein n=1 Tax=Polytomella parva TaxID=51329 RepID=A0A7S0VL03_9CHLO|mmetsp:Transcript_34275/g.61840  ORF Transcript_34275/g.61840 Transcript_34275/m.61840 type:complete len:219 (+) Transcript_34275:95-751(+)